MNGMTRRVVLLLAFAVMPMQGVAATFAVLFCHGDSQLHALHDQDSQHHGSHHDGHHNSQQDDAGSQDNPALHFCCNLTASAPPVVTMPAVLPDFPIRAFAPDSLHDLFIPDRPQRPPLA